MSLWSRISEVLSALAKGAPLSEVFARWSKPPEQTVAFTIAVIALGAKMAKADGHVTRSEVQAFRQVFHIPPRRLNKPREFSIWRDRMFRGMNITLGGLALCLAAVVKF